MGRVISAIKTQRLLNQLVFSHLFCCCQFADERKRLVLELSATVLASSHHAAAIENIYQSATALPASQGSPEIGPRPLQSPQSPAPHFAFPEPWEDPRNGTPSSGLWYCFGVDYRA